MKKVLSIVAALMVAIFAMVSCGAVQSAKDGMAAGETFAKAYADANGDITATAQAYDVLANAGAQYASDNTQTVTFLAGALQSIEDINVEAAGAFLQFYKMVSAQQLNADVQPTIDAMLSNDKKKDDIVKAMDAFAAKIAAAQQAAAEAAAAQEAAAADSTAADAEEAPEE